MKKHIHGSKKQISIWYQKVPNLVVALLASTGLAVFTYFYTGTENITDVLGIQTSAVESRSSWMSWFSLNYWLELFGVKPKTTAVPNGALPPGYTGSGQKGSGYPSGSASSAPPDSSAALLEEVQSTESTPLQEDFKSVDKDAAGL